MKILSQPPMTLEDAYHAGRDCATHGATIINCHFSFFATPELTKEWERGKRDGEGKDGTP